MATPKQYPLDKPDVSGLRMPESSAAACGPVTFPQLVFDSSKPYKSFKIAFIGQTGSGRNSLAWRMSNLDDSELPVLPFLPRRSVVLETSTRPALRHQGFVSLQIRIVPPDDLEGKPFFVKHGGINEYDALVFVFDLGDEESSNEFYTLHEKAKRHVKSKDFLPFLLVGNKVDQRLFGVVTPHKWGENTAKLYSARAYLECSAKSNDRVGDVLDALLKILL